MKKILTIAAIAIIFTSSFANASTLTNGMGGKSIINNLVKATSTNTKAKYTKMSAKDFSIKNMQDTKDILMQLTPAAANTTTLGFAGR